jgi:hypothetical protein
MSFLREWHRSVSSFRGRTLVRSVGFGLVSAALGTGFGAPAHAQFKEKEAPAQLQGEKSLEEKLKEAEGERDDLKKRNADLELRLKQLQATVDDVVHQALGEQPAARPFALPPLTGTITRRPMGPFISQFRPVFPPFGGMPDPVELAVAFSDALGEQEVAKPALEAAKQKVGMGRGATRFDVDAATAQFFKAERKVRLLQNIITTSRTVAADEAERMRKLGIARAVSVVEVRNAETRLKILDEILATDPEAAKQPADSPNHAEQK